MVLKIKQTTHYDYYCSVVFVKCPTVTMMRNSTINNAYLICNIVCGYYEAMILVGGILLGAFKHIWDEVASCWGMMMMMIMIMMMIMTIESVEQRPGWGEHV